MISVIVPVYNCKSTLERCVQAIVSQTFPDWELLLVDDGSMDGSGHLCDQLANEDSRIRVFHKENGGVSSARNLGLDKAQGEFVVFCDSDDWVEPNWCEQLRRIALQRPRSVPICNYFRSSAEGECINSQKACARLVAEIPRRDFFSLNQWELLGIPWNKIFYRSILEENQIRFQPDISLGEDLIFCLDYLHYQEDGFYFVNIPLYHYSVGTLNSLSTKYYADLPDIYRRIYSRVQQEMFYMPGCFDIWHYAYWQSYFFAFDRVFRNAWSKDNPSSVLTKWIDNIREFHSPEFQNCRRMIGKDRINILQYWALQSNCFTLYWIAVVVSEAISEILHGK